MSPILYTIGHSTLPAEAFLQVLKAYEIEMLVDVRRYPGSRRNPQFNSGLLSAFLAENGIRYRHMEDLGGRRKPSPKSINTAWENESFRGYADYMQTAEFQRGIETLMEITTTQRTVIMCAEAVPWRCHRSLIADALIAHGLQVEDILSEKTSQPHQLTAWAKVDGNQVTYPKGTNPPGQLPLF